jgi:hypothetical protein
MHAALEPSLRLDLLRLDPIARSLVPADPSGTGWFSEVQIDRSGSTLFSITPAPYAGWQGWIRWHAPDLATVIAALVLAALLLRTRRVLLWPRRPGRVYCRRCNYDLTPPGPAPKSRPAPTAPRCPECGQDTDERPPVRGRRLRTRAGIPLACGLFALVTCAFVLWFALDSYRATPFSDPWPGAWAARLAPQWCWERADNPDRFGRFRLSRYSLPGLRLLSTDLLRGMNGIRGARPTPDGRFVAAVIIDRRNMRGVQLQVKDVASGAWRTVALSKQLIAGADLVGFSSDGAEAFVQAQLYPGPLPHYPPPTPDPIRTVLYRVPLVTGSPTLIADVPTEFVGVPATMAVPIQFFTVAEHAGTLHWALVTDMDSRGRQSSNIQILTSATVAAHSAPLSVTLSSSSWYGLPQLSEDGRVLQVQHWISPTIDSFDQVDLQSGALTTTSDSNGRCQCPPAADGSSVRPVGSSLQLFDAAGSPMAELGASVPPIWLGGAFISPDARWVAAVRFTSAPGAVANPTAQPIGTSEILLWDIRGLARPLPKP